MCLYCVETIVHNVNRTTMALYKFTYLLLTYLTFVRILVDLSSF